MRLDYMHTRKIHDTIIGCIFSKSERKNGVETGAWEFGQGFISARSAIVNLAEKEALWTRCRSRLTTLTVLTVSGGVQDRTHHGRPVARQMKFPRAKNRSDQRDRCPGGGAYRPWPSRSDGESLR